MIAGLFILIENQYAVDDVVDLDGTAGTVEEITLRKTRLRDAAGVVHHVPNGTIMRASNMSSEFSGIKLNVGVAYDSDLDKVADIVDRIGKELAADAKWGSKIIEAPQFVRVDNFGPFSVEVRIAGKVQPLSQWEVTGELRRQLIDAFAKAHIKMPTAPLIVQEPAAKNKQ
jgi:small conductance mechanosensitive channel